MNPNRNVHGSPVRIAVIIPVFREATVIRTTLSALSSIDTDENVEIVVVDGDQEGSTLAAIGDSAVRKTIARRGRACQLNAGAAATTADILLFLHADTRLPPGAIARVRRCCASPAIVGGAFDLSIDSPRTPYRLIEKAATMRSRITRIPYGDQAIFMKRAVFERLGGYAEISIMEDVELMRRTKQAGGKIAFIAVPVRTSARRWEKDGIVCGTLRNWALLLLFYLGVPPGRLSRFYGGPP